MQEGDSDNAFIGGVSFDGTGSANIDFKVVLINIWYFNKLRFNVTLTDTATALETVRTDGGQSFDGTGNITIASTDLSNTSAITLTSTQTLTNKTLNRFR